MLVFATEIPVDPTKNTDELMKLARHWLGGSPYFKVPEESVPSPQEGEIIEVEIGQARISIGSISSTERNLVGMQMSRTENSKFLWTTEIVGNKSTSFWVSIRVYCEAIGSVLELPRPKKPYILKQIIEKLGTGFDAEIKLSDKPIFLRQADTDKASKIILGTFGNRLPIVYASAGYANHPTVDCERLAKSLSGLAHVAVEPNRAFARRIMNDVEGRNAYGGAIGVYWPDGMGRREKFFEQDYNSPIQMEAAITEYIEQSLSNRRPTLVSTWAFLSESVSRRTIDTLRAAGSTKVDDYIAAFDNELAAKGQQLATAESEIFRLQSEIRRLESNSKTGGTSPLADGQEQDFYPGERRGLLIQVLREALKNLQPGSRRMHLVEDLITANGSSQPSDELYEKIKECLRNYKSMGSKERKILEDLGFEITEDGKHHKVTFMEDTRYSFTISKTPSDYRAGLNAASEIKRKLF